MPPVLPVHPGNVVHREILEVVVGPHEASRIVLNLLRALLGALRATLRTRHELALENLAVRQQLGALQRSVKRPRLSNADRTFWVLLRRWWASWVLCARGGATLVASWDQMLNAPQRCVRESERWW